MVNNGQSVKVSKQVWQYFQSIDKKDECIDGGDSMTEELQFCKASVDGTTVEMALTFATVCGKRYPLVSFPLTHEGYGEKMMATEVQTDALNMLPKCKRSGKLPVTRETRENFAKQNFNIILFADTENPDNLREWVGVDQEFFWFYPCLY